LVLSRKVGERIQIGDDVWVMPIAIRGDKVRLGIDAPIGVTIHREEVAKLIKARSEDQPAA